MIPLGNISADRVMSMPSFTWRLEKENIRGNTDGREAVRQAIYKILMTERYEYLIYSFNYGVELNRLIGKSKSEAKALIPSIIGEALTADSRIYSVYDFEFSDIDKVSLYVRFTASTAEGDIREGVYVSV